MTLSTIQVLERAADLGLKLAIAAPDRLTYQPIEKCPLDFVETLKTYKPRLLSLLRLPFVMVDSQILGETIFFCEDADTRDALVQFGAEEWSIYTKSELRTLCEQNRVAPLSPAELRKVHEIKRTFSGRISS
jgi:hypothetical protein